MKKASLVLAACFVSTGVFAQQPPANRQPSPQEMQQMMEATMAPMAQMMAKTTELMLEITLKKAEEPATAQRIAKFKKNLYDAAIKEGFTKEQAMSIVLSTDLPSTVPAMK